MSLNDQILDFIIKKGEASYTDLIKHFVEGGICSEKTLIGHKREIEASGKLKKKISKETNRPVYYVPILVEEKIEENKFVKIYGEIESYVPSKDFEEMKAKIEKARQEHWKTKRMQNQLEAADMALDYAYNAYSETGLSPGIDIDKAIKDKKEAEEWLHRRYLKKEEKKD